MSAHDRLLRDFLARAGTLQPHKQAMLRALIAKGVMLHHCETIRIRLSHGVPISKVRDEWKVAVEILDEFSVGDQR